MLDKLTFDKPAFCAFPRFSSLPNAPLNAFPNISNDVVDGSVIVRHDGDTANDVIDIMRRKKTSTGIVALDNIILFFQLPWIEVLIYTYGD